MVYRVTCRSRSGTGYARTRLTAKVDAMQSRPSGAFHQIAARIAARGGRLRPDVGRLTRAGTEITGVPVGAWGANELAPRIPGRETLVAAEARRWGEQDQAAAAPEVADEPMGRSELPGAGEVMRAMAALQHSARREQAKPQPPAVQTHVRRPLDLRVWASPTRQLAALLQV
jgi:hypothetical protein